MPHVIYIKTKYEYISFCIYQYKIDSCLILTDLPVLFSPLAGVFSKQAFGFLPFASSFWKQPKN